jgi:hypothetical protein
VDDSDVASDDSDVASDDTGSSTNDEVVACEERDRAFRTSDGTSASWQGDEKHGEQGHDSNDETTAPPK